MPFLTLFEGRETIFLWICKQNLVAQLEFFNLKLLCDCNRNHSGKQCGIVRCHLKELRTPTEACDEDDTS